MNTPKVEKGAWIRLVVLIVALLNSAFLILGQPLLDIGESDVEAAVNSIYLAVSAVGVVIAAIVAWWKDNDFTLWARKHKKPKKPKK